MFIISARMFEEKIEADIDGQTDTMFCGSITQNKKFRK